MSICLYVCVCGLKWTGMDLCIIILLCSIIFVLCVFFFSFCFKFSALLHIFSQVIGYFSKRVMYNVLVRTITKYEYLLHRQWFFQLENSEIEFGLQCMTTVCSAWQFYRTHLETNENHCQMCISISPIGLFFGCSSNPISRGNFKHSLRVLLNLLLKSNLFLFHNWVIFIGIICESTQVFFLQNFLSLLSTFFFSTEVRRRSNFRGKNIDSRFW